MLLDDARRELGVDPDAEPSAVRRAYMRLLRKFKPEVDPVGGTTSSKRTNARSGG